MLKFIYLILLIFSLPAMAQNAVIFKGRYGKLLPSEGLEFKDNKKIISGVSYPPVNAVSAPAGSLYLENSGKLFVKLDSGLTTNWSMVQFASSAYVDPTTTIGDLLYRDGTNTLNRLPIGPVSYPLVSNGTIPVYASIPDVGFADPLTSIGDILYKDAANATTRLPVGPASYPLVSNGTIPVYASIPDVGFEDPLTTNGDIIARIANATTRLGIGSASQVLTVSGGIPQWVTPESGFSDPMTSIGDIIVRDSGNVTTRLGIGPVSYPLVSDGTILRYASMADVGFADPMTSIGDIIIKDAANATARLGIGSASQVLTVSGGIPQWVTSAGGFTSPLTTVGDIIYQNASGSAARLGIGNVSQVLAVVGSLPVWKERNDGWYVSGIIRSTADYVELSSGAEASYVELTKSDLSLTNSSFVIPAEIACASGTGSSGTTCGVDESLGIAFTPPSTCMAKVCAAFYHYMRCTATLACTVNATFSIAETTNSSSAVVRQGQDRLLSAMNFTASASNDDLNDAMTICGYFPVTSGVKSTFRLVYEKAADNNALSNSVGTFLGASRGDPGLHFSAECAN